MGSTYIIELLAHCISYHLSWKNCLSWNIIPDNSLTKSSIGEARATINLILQLFLKKGINTVV